MAKMLQTKDFLSGAPGRIIEIPGGYPAFVPAPLPPALTYDGAMARLIEEANRGVGYLRGCAEMLPNPHMLIRAFEQREALLSSRIEGTVADPQELLFADVTKPEVLPQNVREIRNCVEALKYGVEELKKLPVSLRLIRELHKRLMRGVRGQDERPGEFRDVANYIGRPGGFQNARFIPPPPQELPAALDLFEKFIHSDRTPTPGHSERIPDLVKLALIHYQFEALHPFRDGNGRIGRLLLSLLVCDWNLLPKPLLYLSAYFDMHREAYFDHLLGVSQRGTWNDWIAFFLTGVAEQANDAVERSKKLLELRTQYHEKIQNMRASAKTIKLIDCLFELPAMTIPLAQAKLHISYPAAKQNVQKLVNAGILQPAQGTKHPKLYVAGGVFELISAF